MTTPIKLFYSYSHKDERLRDQLETHLASLKNQGFIESWHDRKILPGTEWAGDIDENLEKADVILLLVSAEFLASDYCFKKETARAIERHQAGDARVIPILLKPVEWSGAPFAHLQALPRDAKPVIRWTSRSEAWTDVAKGIRRAIEDLRARQPPSAIDALAHSAAKKPPSPAPKLSIAEGDLARDPVAPARPPASMLIHPRDPRSAVQTPTRASLRKLLGKVLRGASDLDTFCFDHFPDVHHQFGGGMLRDDKETLLVERCDAAEILDKLRQDHADAVAKHERLLAYA